LAGKFILLDPFILFLQGFFASLHATVLAILLYCKDLISALFFGHVYGLLKDGGQSIVGS
jgi:hypothetical protein